MPIILAEHRATFYQAMESLGNGILAFLAEEPRPDEVQAVREQIVRQVREWSSTSPLIRHSLGKPRGQSSDPELVKRLIRGRPSGADIPSLILNDFYMHSVGGLAYRGRVGLLSRPYSNQYPSMLPPGQIRYGSSACMSAAPARS